MKDQKGMGHIGLIISILFIILVIVGGVFFIRAQFQNEKVQNYETDMLLIQGKIKVLSQEATIQKKEELLKGKKIEENLENEEIKKLLENGIIAQDEENFSKYYILEKENLEELGLNNIELKEGFYIANYATYEVLYTIGVKIGGDTFYKLSDMRAKTEQEESKEEQKEENEKHEEPQATEEQKQ